MGQCFLYGNGIGAGLRVVSGLTAPANPLKNTIWIMSDKASGKFVFGTEKPESPEEGLIWFSATGGGIITEAQVYTDGTWIVVDAYLYVGGDWVQIAYGILDIYASGALNKNYTVLSHLSASDNSFDFDVPIDMTGDCISVSNSGMPSVIFHPPADVTHFKTMEVEMEGGLNGSGWYAIGLGEDDRWDDNGKKLLAKYYTDKAFARKTIQVDISQITGKKYVKICGYSQFASYCKVYRVTLK